MFKALIICWLSNNFKNIFYFSETEFSDKDEPVLPVPEVRQKYDTTSDSDSVGWLHSVNWHWFFFYLLSY